MKYKEYSQNIWDQIHLSIKKNLEIQSKTAQKIYAAFDADGTLWDIDLGETFFQYQIEKKLVPLPPNPWEHYLHLKSQACGPEQAYLWLAQINKNVPLDLVRKWAADAALEATPIPIFQEQKKLIDLLKKSGVEVFIVTASVKWAVEPGAALLGLSNDVVIGVETKVTDSGLITEQQEGTITYKSGKVSGLLAKTNNQKPFLVSGNTEGDLALLEASSDIRLAVSAACRDDKLFKTESALQLHAKSKGWLSHRFI